VWWSEQNLEKPRRNPSGELWHFRVWHDHVAGVYTQRIFFWNDAKSESGMLELTGDKARHVTQLKQLIAKLAKHPDYRAKFHRPLEYPVEHKYAAYSPLVAAEHQ